MLACSGLGFEVLPDLQAQRNKKLRRKQDKRNWAKSFSQECPHRLGGLLAENQSPLFALFSQGYGEYFLFLMGAKSQYRSPSVKISHQKGEDSINSTLSR